MGTLEYDLTKPLSAWPADRDPAEAARLAKISIVAIVAHLCLLGAVAWSERTGRATRATAAVEIPVEMVTPEEAEGRPETKQPPPPGASTAIEPRDEARPAPQTQQATPAQNAEEPGKVVERPKESDLPQAARTHGGETKPETPAEEPANPFGGLADVQKPAPVEPTPTFLSPQSMMTAARPKPAQDPTNDNYRAKVLGKVAANMIDPERPRPKALAIVGFRVDARGGLESAWLARPSGHADLDAEALDMVRRSAPFPPPPAGADHNFGAAIAFGGE
ncbi:MAG: TonB family protein [Methylobacteriaceae bacterium]|nr:TonB family protein [Methylobacteriaceae bacterium]